jgi:hypothetical protein
MSEICAASFLVFSGHRYYPGPAWEDMRGVCPTRAAACDLLVQCRAYGLDWYQVVDLATLSVVDSGAFDGRDEFGEDNWVFTPDKMARWRGFLDRPLPAVSVTTQEQDGA